MIQFTMPSLGADMDEGTLLEWLVRPGDTVHKGDVVAVVDTAKAAVEVECFTSGVVQDLLVEPGTTVAVGTALAVIGDSADVTGPAQAAAPEAGPVVPEPRTGAATPVTPVTSRVRSPLVRHAAEVEGIDLTRVAGTGPGGAVRRADLHPRRTLITPYARRLAESRGLDLATLRGTGPHGEVRARDLPAAVAAPARPDRDGRMREAIAKLMTRSKHEIPHYYLRTTVDLAAATEWLREHNRSVTVQARVVPAALLMAATARAATDVPELNGYWVDGAAVLQPSVHLGVAVSLRSGGMVTPAIRDAQALPLAELMLALRDAVTRARTARLRASELTDATLTVTDLGERGVEEVFGVIYPPQLALVGFGAIADRPWAVDGLLGVRPLVTVTLSADHRASDGYLGARFLNRIDHHLHDPAALARPLARSEQP